MHKIDYGGFTFEIPEYVNHRGKRYEAVSSSYSFHKDVASKWAKSRGPLKQNEKISLAHFKVFIVKSFPSKEVIKRVGHQKLYVLYSRYVE